MARWKKLNKLDKGQRFKCSECGGICICCCQMKEVKGVTYCDYDYCPRCGEEMESSNRIINKLNKVQRRIDKIISEEFSPEVVKVIDARYYLYNVMKDIANEVL